jgi:hypothetical protein
VFFGAFLAEVLGRQGAAVGLPGVGLGPEFSLFLAVPDLEGHGQPGLLPGKHAFDVLERVGLVDQSGTVGGEVGRQKGSCRRDPVRQSRPRRSGPAPIRARGGGVGEQDIGEQGLGKRVLRQLIVSNQGLGERVLRRNVVGVHEVGIIVIRKPAVRNSNASNAMVPSGNAPKGNASWGIASRGNTASGRTAPGTAAACRAPPCGASGVRAELPMPSIDTVWQGGLTF